MEFSAFGGGGEDGLGEGKLRQGVYEQVQEMGREVGCTDTSNVQGSVFL